MKRTRTLRIWGGFWLLLLLLFTFLIWNIFAGSVLVAMVKKQEFRRERDVNDFKKMNFR